MICPTDVRLANQEWPVDQFLLWAEKLAKDIPNYYSFVTCSADITPLHIFDECYGLYQTSHGAMTQLVVQIKICPRASSQGTMPSERGRMVFGLIFLRLGWIS